MSASAAAEHAPPDPTQSEEEEDPECRGCDADVDFRADCKHNLRQYLETHKGMTAAEARRFVSTRIKIKVSNARYDGSDEVTNVSVRSEIAAAGKSGTTDASNVAKVRLKHEYCHRVGWSELTHFAALSYRMPDAAGKVFESTMEDAPHENAHQVEMRNFSLARSEAEDIRDTIFGEGWTTIEVMMMCYGAAGVHYLDSNAQMKSAAELPACKNDWLEHHTRKMCKALDEDDEGYETESFEQRYSTQLAEAKAFAGDCTDSGDIGSEDDDSEFDM